MKAKLKKMLGLLKTGGEETHGGEKDDYAERRPNSKKHSRGDKFKYKKHQKEYDKEPDEDDEPDFHKGELDDVEDEDNYMNDGFKDADHYDGEQEERDLMKDEMYQADTQNQMRNTVPDEAREEDDEEDEFAHPTSGLGEHHVPKTRRKRLAVMIMSKRMARAARARPGVKNEP